MKTVSDLVGNPAPLSARPADELGLALQTMLWGGVRHLPVVDRRGRVVGVVSEHDLLRRQADVGTRTAAREPVRAVMTSPPVVAAQGDEIAGATRTMLDREVGCLPVVDAAGALAGLITRTDLLRASLPSDQIPTAVPETAQMLMHRQPITVAADDYLLDAVARMQAHGIRHLPVVDGERHVVGMLSDRDVRVVLGRDSDSAGTGGDVWLRTTRVGDVMTRRPFALSQDAPFAQVVHAFTDQRIGAVPVLDQTDHLVGIISYVDVLKNAGAL